MLLVTWLFTTAVLLLSVCNAKNLSAFRLPIYKNCQIIPEHHDFTYQISCHNAANVSALEKTDNDIEWFIFNNMAGKRHIGLRLSLTNEENVIMYSHGSSDTIPNKCSISKNTVQKAHNPYILLNGFSHRENIKPGQELYFFISTRTIRHIALPGCHNDKVKCVDDCKRHRMDDIGSVSIKECTKDTARVIFHYHLPTSLGTVAEVAALQDVSGENSPRPVQKPIHRNSSGSLEVDFYNHSGNRNYFTIRAYDMDKQQPSRKRFRVPVDLSKCTPRCITFLYGLLG